MNKCNCKCEYNRISDYINSYAEVGHFTVPSYNGAPDIAKPTKMITIRTTDKKKVFFPFIKEFDIPLCILQVMHQYVINVTIYGPLEELSKLSLWLKANWSDSIKGELKWSTSNSESKYSLGLNSLKFETMECNFKDSNKFCYTYESIGEYRHE